MNKEILTFTDIEIEKTNLHHHKNPNLTDDLDINKILISHKVCYKKIINIVLVTKKIKKLSHNLYCLQK